jgi:hypothetical protein
MANATGQLTTEFDVPYQLKLQPDGELLEMSGSFSWALPQNLMAVLATAPNFKLYDSRARVATCSQRFRSP